MTEVELYQPRQLAVPSAAITERDVVDGWVQVVSKVAKLADMIADTEFVPKALRNKPAAITACMLTGREIGIGPMLSMKVIHMVNGTPSLAAEYKRARALDRGHEIVYDETSITRCVVRGRRRNEDSWVTVTWTIEDAKRAKLAGKDVWQQNPRRMLEARATGELCDLKFPDCSWGLATTEALQDGDVAEFADVPDRPAVETPAPAPRTAQRRQRAAEKPAERPTPAPPAAAAEPPTAARRGPAPTQDAPSGLPPLPCEDESPDPTAPPQPDTASPPSGSAAGDPHPPLDPDEHGTSTRGKGGQLTALWTVLNTVYGFEQKTEARGVVEKLVSRKLDGGTTGNLSYNEARAVLDTLSLVGRKADEEGIDAREKLIEFLVQIDETLGQDHADG
jgi:hypothetical protein